ncbi:hypothetical protein [Pseudomonas sp. 28 E 9]|uniref:hypothetical protein n=1 Tax=Pseudomonas sp. 28 E 9 TaxID=1844098 RepID=UPI00081214D9|nr:hypothetical protein [Pseudomonas sp. 28 E 9]CRL97377.1 hypothetical protein [Pseudomonas sp. 28 E 9]CRM06856.1 hypothetical protein [Pseudomonas sp. 28 E 9]
MEDFKLFDVSDLTRTTVNPTISDHSAFDFVARVKGSTTSNFASVSIIETDSLIQKFSQYALNTARDISVLKGVVNWQHKVIDYNSSYAALLMEQIDEEEFERVAVEFAETQVDYSSGDLADCIERVHNLTGIEYTVMDYANMFGCGEEAIEGAILNVAADSLAMRLWSEGKEE